MTEERWRELLRRFPGRCIYPEFNPDRKREPWIPMAASLDWRRADERKATIRTVRRGWGEQ